MSQQQSITKFMTRRSARNDSKTSPVDEKIPVQPKGRTRTTQSPVKKEESSPRKSSRQIAKASDPDNADKQKNAKPCPLSKKPTTPKPPPENSTPTKVTKVTRTISGRSISVKDSSPSKTTKSAQSKSKRTETETDIIDELQGIEDFLRESTNEIKELDSKDSPKKSPSKIDKQVATPSKDKSTTDKHILKHTASTPEAKNAPDKLKSKPEANAVGESKSLSSKQTAQNDTAPSLDKVRGIKRKLENDNEPALDNNKNISNTENTKEPIREFVVPEEDFSDESKVTDEKCGNCINCKRKPCFECSSCKREDFNNCIDVYCMNQREHRDQRQAMRELYLQARQKDDSHPEEHKQESEKQIHSAEPDNIKKKVLDTEKEISSVVKVKKPEGGNVKARFSEQGVVFEIEDAESGSDDDELSIEEKIDKVMAKMVKNDKLSPEKLQSLKSKVSKTINEKYSEKNAHAKERKKNRTDYVYGGSSKAKKVRRCGECEGCTRDDCGKCIGCLDKPKFGGKNTRKQACTMRKCRMK